MPTQTVVRLSVPTPILVSGLNFRRGRPFELLELARIGRIRLAVSRPILDEVEDVLRRKFRWNDVDVTEGLNRIRDMARTVISSVRLDVIKEDPDDNKILECASVVGADDIGCRNVAVPSFSPGTLQWPSMAQLLAGMNSVVLGVANKWSLAYAISAAFVREGASLYLTYQGERQRETVEELGAELKATKVLPCDVTKQEELNQLVQYLKREAPVIDAVVHSIAFANREDLSRPFLETSRDGYLLAQEVSAYSLVSVARALSPLMTRGGSLTTLTYLGATRVVQNYNVMGVAKAALEASVRYLASDLGPSNIRVNAISAGPVKTTSARGIKDFSKVLEGVAAMAPLRRNTDPAEVADAAVFLASHLGRGVTGNTLFVDSGFQIVGLGLGA